MCIYQPPHKRALLAHEWGALSDGHAFRLGRDLADSVGGGEFLSRMQGMDQMLYLPDDILVKVDRASMAVGLETRAPLLDYHLAEFMSTVPEGLRYHNGTKKYLLKQAVRAKLPAEIIDRPKMGFAVPLKYWFHGQAAELVRDILLSKSARERGIFRPQELQRLIDGHHKGRDFSSQLWAAVFFESWCQTWLDHSVTAVDTPSKTAGPENGGYSLARSND